MATAAELMQQLSARAKERALEAAEIGASFCFNLTGDGGGHWLVQLKQPVGVTQVDSAAEADCTLTLSADDFVALLEGQANAQHLFFQGRLQVAGEMHHALKLQQLTELLQ